METRTRTPQKEVGRSPGIAKAMGQAYNSKWGMLNAYFRFLNPATLTYRRGVQSNRSFRRDRCVDEVCTVTLVTTNIL